MFRRGASAPARLAANEGIVEMTEKPASATGTWYALCTKPRAEKKLQSMLQAWHILNVLPTYVKVRKVQRRTVRVDLPVFPRYMMARLDGEERLRVLKTNMTVGMLPLTNARAVLRQLHQIVRAANGTEEFSLVAPAGTGERVRIVNGPMKGLEGRTRTVNGKLLLTVNMEAFGGAFEVQVSPDDISQD